MEGKSSLARKTNKTRRETAVQGTNDSSIVSKCSTSSCGYFNDPFLHFFVSKLSRRAPLIHRGYYIRAVAFDRLLKNFLGLHEHSKKQIISLGCGFDSSYFRLKAAQCLADTIFCEVDFPELVRKKRLLIENTEELITLVEKTNEPPLSPHIEFSCSDYHLLGVDLTQLNTLEAALKMCGIDFECPTLLLSECVMTYMTRRCSTELVKWAAETFEEAVFGMYEQMSPDDAFGLFMQNHFHSIGSPLKCINAFPSLESQRKRFLSTGWAWCEALDMNTFYYHNVPEHEKRRIESLEAFDEYEELNLKYSHYFILTASLVTLSKSLITDGPCSPESQYPSICKVVKITRVPEDVQSVRRFGHASSLVNGLFAISSGGFGEIDGRHQRLTEITVTDVTTFKSSHILCCSADLQCSRMHHASVSLSDGTTFLIGGRQSPYFMCNQMLKVRLHICQKHKLSAENSGDVQSQEPHHCHLLHKKDHEQQEQPVPDQHRSKTTVCKETSPLTEDIYTSVTVSASPEIASHKSNDCNGRFSVRNLAQSGCDQIISADVNVTCHCDEHTKLNPLTHQNDSNSEMFCTFDVGHVHISVVCQKGSVPKERWRHAATDVIINGQEKIFMHGGKTKSSEILGDSFLFDPVDNTWEQLSCSGDIPGPRHSHCVSYWNGHVVLSGGLDMASVPSGDVFLLNLNTKAWEKLPIAGNLYSRYSHTAHIMLEDYLLLVGGVNLHHPPPGVAIINLRIQKALEFTLPDQDKSNLLMFHRHTSITLDQENIVVLGGGGNCFSFGTHLNRSPVILNVGSCIDAVER